jgi:hypothetical protein
MPTATPEFERSTLDELHPKANAEARWRDGKGGEGEERRE